MGARKSPTRTETFWKGDENVNRAFYPASQTISARKQRKFIKEMALFLPVFDSSHPVTLLSHGLFCYCCCFYLLACFSGRVDYDSYSGC